MIIGGIIAEYNPFHNGHSYQIHKTRLSGVTHMVAVMSGNYIQRGSGAITLAQIRANAAIVSGIDLVVELPLPYSMATAERFAYGAISIIKGMGCIDLLSFGAETEKLEHLQFLANHLEDRDVILKLKSYLTEGLTYAKARQIALSDLFSPKFGQLLKAPNNILAVEYLKQLIDSTIKPLAIQRIAITHHSDATHGIYASASHLRKLISTHTACEHTMQDISHFVPKETYSLLEQAEIQGLLPYDEKKSETAILAQLRKMSVQDFKNLPDISEGLENRLFTAVRRGVCLDDVLSLAKTKRYTLSRLRRLLHYAYLGIDNKLLFTPPPYIRILAANSRGIEIIQKMKTTATLPISHSLAHLSKQGQICGKFAELTACSTDLYTLGLPKPQPCGYDFTYKFEVMPSLW